MIDPLAPAVRLLAAVTAAFAAAASREAPERQFLAPGPMAAWDGEQLAVALSQTLPGTSDLSGQAGGLNARSAGSMQMPRAVYQVRLLRAVPTIDDSGHAPPLADIDGSARGLLQDLGIVLTGIYQFVADSPPGSVVTVGQSDPLGPQGGLGGHMVPVTISPMQ